jgi:beta-alanine degradation protein BauB
MKNILKLVALGLVLISTRPLMAADSAAGKMDPLTVAPDMYSLVFENERVRVMQVVFKAGQSIKKHTHSNDHFVYVLEGGQLTITKADGSSSVADLKTGQVVWIPAETHSAKNTGTTQVKLLVNELKK